MTYSSNLKNGEFGKADAQSVSQQGGLEAVCLGIRLFSADNVDQLVWPDTQEAWLVRSLLLPMLKEGVTEYIRNVNTKLYLLQVNSHILPLTVNDKEYNNSYLTSNYFPIKYLEEQLIKKKHLLHKLGIPIVQGVGSLLKMLKINKTVIVNNWLLTTNIYPTLTGEEWRGVTHILAKKFPDHTLMFRSLNDHACPELKNELYKQNYHLIYSRTVYIYDPEYKMNFSQRVHYHHRRDRRLASAQGYEMIRYHHIQQEEGERLLQLYASIYLKRHTCYGPQYTERYLHAAIASNFLRLVGIKKDNDIHGVIGFHQRENQLIAPFFGYNEKFGKPNHLYRMLTMVAIDEAENQATALYDGSGGEETKHKRGMCPFPEYVALYDGHLPPHRRFFWSLAEKCVKKR